MPTVLGVLGDEGGTESRTASGSSTPASSVSLMPQQTGAEGTADPSSLLAEKDNLLFNVDKLNDAVTHANDMTRRYGVEILSINIISAKPAHDELMQSLAKGAVAAAEAQQLEITARGRAKSATIMARGEADAEITRAEGSKTAAKLLNEQPVAVQLAFISQTGEALSKAQSNLILGTDGAAQMGGMFANPEIFKMGSKKAW